MDEHQALGKQNVGGPGPEAEQEEVDERAHRALSLPPCPDAPRRLRPAHRTFRQPSTMWCRSARNFPQGRRGRGDSHNGCRALGPRRYRETSRAGNRSVGSRADPMFAGLRGYAFSSRPRLLGTRHDSAPVSMRRSAPRRRCPDASVVMPGGRGCGTHRFPGFSSSPHRRRRGTEGAVWPRPPLRVSPTRSRRRATW